MEINLQIKFADGTEKTIVANAADFIAFENKFDRSIATLQNDPRLTYLLFLAWNAEKRKKVTDLEFDAWVESVEGVEAKEAKK
jgi:hypothetical protein